VLSSLELPEGVALEIRRRIGFELLDSLEPADELILVDAARTGEEVGSCHVIDLDGLAALSSTPYCCHGVGLPELLSAIDTLRPEALPKRVRVLAVEVVVTDECSTALSGPVRRALPEAVARVLTLVDAPQTLVDEGCRKGREAMDWQPAPTEVMG
jgi:hydrogenase maturation protease